MPEFICKPTPDSNEYVMWSTVVDGPISDVLTRAEMFDFALVTSNATPNAPDKIEARLQRADTNGLSSFGQTPSWETERYVVDEDAMLPHRLVAEYTRAPERSARRRALTTPAD
ncbi:MAG: hypothetical protein GX542_01675 [Rhodococcus sp.]|nr:hypothetical protein [Rhodococcus sp. (in: high G+C Gram-positive bacteria)]